MTELLESQQSYERHLRQDPQGRFVAHYGHYTLASVFQPIVGRDRQILAYEGLLRVVDTQGRPVAPDTLFHRVAASEEEFVHQANLDRLSRVIHLRNFAATGLVLKLHLNVLPATAAATIGAQVRQELMRKRVEALGLIARNIIFEVTEDHLVDEQSLATSVAQMRANGFDFSIDDFGSEGSSPARVRLIRPSIVKLDRTLLLQYEQGRHAPLLDALALAVEVAAVTVIEGVEDEVQFQMMREAGVDQFQGYHLGRPAAF